MERLRPMQHSTQLRARTEAAWQRPAKRALDVIGAAAGLILLAPLFLLLAVLIRLDSPGPALYYQPRIGRAGRLFKLLKFRTMVPGAPGALLEVFKSSPQQQKHWRQFQKLSQDPRITRVGRVLRRLSLDELPQLWNVLRGDMSLVGPRPILPYQQAVYGKQTRRYRQVRPGMTGLWQVSGRSRLTFQERIRLDSDYIGNWSLKLDLIILVRTLPAVLRGDGAC